jgi:acyl carrier protein phosphodiesterase
MIPKREVAFQTHPFVSHLHLEGTWQKFEAANLLQDYVNGKPVCTSVPVSSSLGTAGLRELIAYTKSGSQL